MFVKRMKWKTEIVFWFYLQLYELVELQYC